jgi:hypothetical protein
MNWPPCARASILLLATVLATACAGRNEQRPDPDYRPDVAAPTFPVGTGPVVCVDEAHHNFHTIAGRFGPFARLLGADGFRLQPSRRSLRRGVPATCEVLVIANAQPSARAWDDYPYPTPPAFDAAEIRHIVVWVRGGGRLLLIADHMPFPGAAATLAAEFDCQFLDGFTVAGFTTEEEARAAFLRPTLFSTDDGTLRPAPATAGRSAAPAVTTVATFVGQAFQCGPQATALLVLPSDQVSLMPRKAWQFTMETPRIAVGGWLQGATLDHGAGRVAIFGEAAMFTAQIADDGRPMGMNAPGAEQNARYVLNLVEWLAGP